MKISKRVLAIGAGAAVAAACAIAIPAIASQGKVGLWNVTVTLRMAGAGMPDLSKLPPQAREQAEAILKARGINMNGNRITVTHCMTPEEVNAGHPGVNGPGKTCSLANVKKTANSFSAGMTCTGQVSGKGHIQVTWDSPEHYTGTQTLTGTANGRPMSQSSAFDARWVSADCKGAH